MRSRQTMTKQTLAGPMRRIGRLSRGCGLLAAVLAACSLCDSAIGSTNLVADSVADYSLVQGQSNWHYGYCSSNYSVAGFVPFSTTGNCCGFGRLLVAPAKTSGPQCGNGAVIPTALTATEGASGCPTPLCGDGSAPPLELSVFTESLPIAMRQGLAAMAETAPQRYMLMAPWCSPPQLPTVSK